MKQLLHFVITGVLLLAIETAFSQKQANHWFFGVTAGIDFSSGVPVFQQGSMNAGEGCSSISDSLGNLLFYTNGTRVWDRNHNLMPNNLIGPGGIASSSQAALIVPQPGNDSIFYVFITAQIEFTTTKGLFYGIVNMKKNGGLGDVVQTYTTLYSNYVHEKIAAVKHANGQDIWLLTHVAGNNEFLEYKITAAGLNTTPVTIAVGNTTDGFLDRMGYLKVSPDGSRIAMACTETRLELFQFNTATGAITDAKVIPKFPNTNCRGFYGIEFSCDSKLLYTSYFYLCSSNALMNYLLQYKIDFTDVNDIINSKFIVDSALSSNRRYGALQMAPDGKILAVLDNKNYISAITNPGVYGNGCGFVAQHLNFPATAITTLGLPNFIQSYFNNTKPSLKTNGNCNSNTVSFSLDNLNIVDSVRWNFGDPASGALNFSPLVNPVHTFSANGFYQVTALVYKKCKTDTLQKMISVGDTHTLLGIDTAICPGSTFTRRVAVAGATYSWQDGSTADSFKIQAPGIYWVKVLLDNCTSVDSIIVSGKPLPVFTLGKDTSICEATQLLLDVTGSGDGYSWQNGSALPVYTVTQAGNYFVTVTKAGCSKTDSIVVMVKNIPRPDLGADAAYCTGQTVTLNPGTFTGNYLWQDGSTSLTYLVAKPGLYKVDIINECGTGSDAVNINFAVCKAFFPAAFTPNGDGKNDAFRVTGTSIFKQYRLQLYSRWGELIFETANAATGWNGKYREKDQPGGAYIWKADFITTDGQAYSLKGSVILLR